MADAKIRYQIQPQEIDADGNENLLSLYIIDATGNNSTKLTQIVLDSGIFVDLPVVSDHKSIELISDQPISFAIYTNNIQTIEIANCTNIILKANMNYTYKVKNNSGYTANIQWRVYS